MNHTTQEKEWERWVRTLSDSSNPRDTDLLVAKIAVLLRTTLQQAVEEEREKLRKAVEGIPIEVKKHGAHWEGQSYAYGKVLALLTSTDKSV